MPTAQQHIKNMVKIIDSVRYYDRRTVFGDFVEMGAIAYSNTVDLHQRAGREGRYLDLIGKYQPKEQKLFPVLIGELVEAQSLEPGDILGRLFHELNAANAECGQFFTPFHLCELIAKVTTGDSIKLKAEVAERGFICLSEPACGAGAMVIAYAHSMLEMGINFQEHLHATLTDIDSRAVHMAYLQLCVLHIPAVVVHGNTITVQEYSHWFTPAHILGGFGPKLRRGFALDSIWGRGRGDCRSRNDGQDSHVPIEQLLASKVPMLSITEQAALF